MTRRRSPPLTDSQLASPWADLQAASGQGDQVTPDAYRLAFADPEFMLRPETRGVRLQLELLKPELAQSALGVEHTIVVFGSARFLAPDVARAQLAEAAASGDAERLRVAERDLRNSAYYEAAYRFGRLVASHTKHCVHLAERLFICTGGGPGVMEAANRGAFDEHMPTLGLNIELPHEQSANPYVTPDLAFKFHYFAMRKMHFMMRARALVAFPGGFGTLDEFFEVLTLVQCRKSERVPIVLYGSEYWHRLISFELLVEEGTISPEDMDLLTFVDNPDDAWRAICRFYELTDAAAL